MSQQSVQIVIAKPEGYVHAEAFRELAETLQWGFEQLGIKAEIRDGAFLPGATIILLGWHLLEEAQWAVLPKGSILYNLEQMDERNRELRTRLADLAKDFRIWDYSLRNIEILRESGFQAPVTWVPVGHAPALDRIPKAPVQDIDVLFYGSANDRRLRILRALEAEGLRVQTLFGVYGAERDALIARSKVVLNLHYYESSIFEMVRVSYLLTNGVAVVAECHAQTEVDEDIRGAAVLVPYEHLVRACVELAGSPQRREILARRGRETMALRDQARILAGAWGLDLAPAPPFPAPPAVSVVVITRNRPVFLRRALQSLETQLFKDFEVLVVNDGGEDVSGILETSTRAGLNLIPLNHASQRGQSAARNTALLQARGRWIAYLDDDDLYYPEHLELLVANLRQTGAWVAYSDSVRAIEEERDGQWVVTSRELAMSHPFDRDHFLRDNLTPINNVVHERACWEIAGPHDETLPVLEDWDYWIRLSRFWDFLHVPKITAEVRWRANGANITFEQQDLFPRCRARIAEKVRLAEERKHRLDPSAPEALLFEPDWATSEWAEVLLSYLQAFRPGEPVALILPLDPKLPGQLPLEEAQGRILDLVTRTGREAFPDVVIVDKPEELLDTLKAYVRVQRIPKGKGNVQGLIGEVGSRFAQIRRQLAAK